MGRHKVSLRGRQLKLMAKIKSVCVYCGSAEGLDPAYLEAANIFGTALAREKICLVYGGGGIGMMGAVADAVQNAGGSVLGVIPEFLIVREQAKDNGRELLVVPDMHVRKRVMFDKADAFVALPGGIGTLEELVEQLAWLQLEQHKKPLILANIKGFWNPLIALFRHLQTEGFVYGKLPVLVADKAADILPKLQTAASAIPEHELHGIATKAVIEHI
jgi:uncharacterized protein (TIGR00730 family)